MRMVLAVGLILSIPSILSAQEWREELRADLVVLRDGKMVIEEYSIERINLPGYAPSDPGGSWPTTPGSTAYFLAKPGDNLKPARFTDVITGASTCEFVGFFLPPAPSPSFSFSGRCSRRWEARRRF